MPSEKNLKEQTKFILSYASSMIGWYFVVWVYAVFYCILHREYIDIVGCTAMSKDKTSQTFSTGDKLSCMDPRIYQLKERNMFFPSSFPPLFLISDI